MNNVSPSIEIATVVIAAATVIYTIGTFLLWRATQNNVTALHGQVKLLDLQISQQAIFNKVLATNAALDSHREIWFPVISNPVFVALLNKNEPGNTETEQTTGEFLGSILIPAHLCRKKDVVQPTAYGELLATHLFQKK